MLEQRRAQDKGFITLKEAAVIADYSPDYVGQLIRAGKIKGEQVYSNVAWVTTENEIRSYLASKGRTIPEDVDGPNVFLHKVARISLYTLIAVFAAVLLFLQYILYVSIDTHISQLFVSSADVQTLDS